MSGILVIAEQRRGELRPVSLELIDCGSGRCAAPGDEVAVAVLSDSPQRFVGRLERGGSR